MQNPQGPSFKSASIKFATIAALTLATFATTAIAQQQPSAATQPAAPAQTEQKPTNAAAAATGAKATIYVYRLREMAGLLNKPSIYVDEKEIARIRNGRFFVVNLDPGRHVIHSQHKPAIVNLDVNPGQVYYIRVAWEFTSHGDRAATTLIPLERGWAEMSQTEPSDPSDIKDHELASVGEMPPRPTPALLAAQDPITPGPCRSIALVWAQFPSGRYKVVDVINYPGASVGKAYVTAELPTLAQDGVKIFLLTKGYTPEDVARAHNFCQSPEGTVADAQLAADITRMIRTLEAADHPGCDLQIVKQLHSADKPGIERWDIKSCDVASSYDVQIVPSPKGGSDFQAVKSKGVQTQDKTTETAAPPPASAQPAPADASPEQWLPYEGQKSQFTISLPKGWVAYDQSLMQQMLPGKGNSRFNLIVFYLSPNPSSKNSTTIQFEMLPVELMAKIDSGEVPSFFLQKFPAKGMSCAGFSEKAEKDVFKMITGDRILGKGATILEAPRSEPISAAGCKGIRVRGIGQPARENTPQTLDAYAVSDGKVLYLFTLRNQAGYYKKNAEVFQKSMATAKLAAAAP
jgi:hypothetical protein